MPKSTPTPRERGLMFLSYALFVFALVSATQPWWTGIYTMQQQQRLEERMSLADRWAPKNGPAASWAEPSPPTAAQAAQATKQLQRDRFGLGQLDGWEQEDVAYWRTLHEQDAFATLEIPRIQVKSTVVKGVTLPDLRLGPGWMPETDLPGPSGNCVISGHRTTYLAPFRNIDELREGDTILLTSPYRTYTYEVIRTRVVKPTDMSVTHHTDTPILTLTACHPPFSAAKRIVVQARLVSVSRK